jgi:hypothetical protein
MFKKPTINGIAKWSAETLRTLGRNVRLATRLPTLWAIGINPIVLKYNEVSNIMDVQYW